MADRVWGAIKLGWSAWVWKTIHCQVALPGWHEGKMQNRTMWGPMSSKPEPHKGSVHVLTTLWFGTSSFRCGMSYLIQQLCIKLLEYNTAHAGNLKKKKSVV